MRRSLIHGRLCRLERHAHPAEPPVVGILDLTACYPSYDGTDRRGLVSVWRAGVKEVMTLEAFEARYPTRQLIRIVHSETWPPEDR
jgi:hypothetical protein